MNRHPVLLTAALASLAIAAFFPPMLAQEDDVGPTPEPVQKSMPPEAYTFAMKLSPGTDCVLQGKPIKKNPEAGGGQSGEDAATATMTVERFIRKKISLSKETAAGDTGESFYFVGGMCAYESPRKGVNVRRAPSGHDLSDLSVYHFPELAWAVPETRIENLNHREAAMEVYRIANENRRLEVDPHTKYPLRFRDGDVEWTYTYKDSDSPVVLPETLRNALRSPNYE